MTHMHKAASLFILALGLVTVGQTAAAKSVTCSVIFTAEALPAPKRLTVAAAIKALDQTAAELHDTPEFRSPVAWRKRTAQLGLPGLDLPLEIGGKGLKAEAAAQVFERAGYHNLNLRDVIGGGHARPLLKSLSPSVQKIVKDVAEGKAYVAIAITEKSAGSNMRAMESLSEKVEGGYLLSGAKMYNARFSAATHLVLFTKSAGGLTEKLNAFVLPINYRGLNFSELNASGLRGNSLGGVSFDRVFVPDEFRLGEEGGGGRIFREHFVYWRLMQASAAIGTGRNALDQVVKRLRERTAFGGPIGRFTHLQQALSEHTSKLHMASLLVKEAAKKFDQGQIIEASRLAAMVKAEGVEWSLAAADFAMQVFGAEGYTDLVDLSERVSDLQGLRIADGTTHVMRQEVVRQTYGEDFWTMAIGTDN